MKAFQAAKKTEEARLKKMEEAAALSSRQRKRMARHGSSSSTSFTSPSTREFASKHVASPRANLAERTREVAGQRSVPRSTQVVISPQEQAFEARKQIETLKASEAMTEAGTYLPTPKYGVNKPTFHAYRTQTSSHGSLEAEKVGNPVLGLNPENRIVHLERDTAENEEVGEEEEDE